MERERFLAERAKVTEDLKKALDMNVCRIEETGTGVVIDTRNGLICCLTIADLEDGTTGYGLYGPWSEWAWENPKAMVCSPDTNYVSVLAHSVEEAVTETAKLAGYAIPRMSQEHRLSLQEWYEFADSLSFSGPGMYRKLTDLVVRGVSAKELAIAISMAGDNDFEETYDELRSIMGEDSVEPVWHIRHMAPERLYGLMSGDQRNSIFETELMRRKAKELAEMLSPAQKDAAYRAELAAHTAEDAFARMEETMPDVEQGKAGAVALMVGQRWAYDGDYDCNLTYWGNIDSLCRECLEGGAV